MVLDESAMMATGRLEPDPFRERVGYIALGANLGDREESLARALRMLGGLAGMEVLRVSSFYETQPEGFASENQFLNAVAEVVWKGSPETLLLGVQLIEEKLGRRRERGRSGYEDRPIDLDIIWLEDVKVDSPNLKIPHPRAGERDFVLRPLEELNPELAEQLRAGG
jgi:2-amino-4-hydroxy-6-hydroxymethyldihydropteridine diphosphokinase